MIFYYVHVLNRLLSVCRCLVFFVAREFWHVLLFFFFSSRRRHTIAGCAWSSDVCSSDLGPPTYPPAYPPAYPPPYELSCRSGGDDCTTVWTSTVMAACALESHPSRRSEERRAGKECRSRGSPEHEKKKKKNERSSRIS